MSQFNWPLLETQDFGLPPGSTMNLLPKYSRDSDWEIEQERRAREARKGLFGAYSNQDKGTNAGPSITGSPCDLQFLQIIWQNIRCLRRCMSLDMPNDQAKFPDLALAIPIVLDETCLEMERLIENPELLPQGTGRFFELVEGELQLLLDSVQLNQKEEQGLQKLAEQHPKRTLAEYDEDRTTWQQFLHNKAPGSGFPKEQMHRHGFTQMATAASQFLVNHKSEEYNACSRSLEEARGDPLPQRKHTIAGVAPHQDFVRRTDWKPHLPSSKRPGPKEPAWLGRDLSLQSLAGRYPRLARRWTRVRLRPQTFRANLVNDLAITEMRRLIKLAESRDRT